MRHTAKRQAKKDRLISWYFRGYRMESTQLRKRAGTLHQAAVPCFYLTLDLDSFALPLLSRLDKVRA